VSVLFVLILRSQKKADMKRMLSYRLLSVRLPHQQEQEGKFGEDINQSEQFFTLLASIKGGASLEAAVHHVGEEIHFYVSVPEAFVAAVSRRIEGLFKNAVIEHAPEYNIFQEGGNSNGVWIGQGMHYALPIRTYQEAQTDTFSSVLSGLSNINEVGEGMTLQVMMRKAPDSYKKTIISIINNLRKGERFSTIASKYSIGVNDLVALLGPERVDENDRVVIDQDALRLLEEKISKPLIQINYRIVASSPSAHQTTTMLEGVSGAFSQFEAPLRNKLVANKSRSLKTLLYNVSFRRFDEKQTMVLNTQELASIFHFPTTTTISPNIKWLKSKEAAPPVNLPAQGVLVGETHYRGERKEIRISDDDRRRHFYIIGQTGTGKSTLMINMVLDDIQNGKGVAVIDPHGDLVETIAGLIPSNRADDVIFFDPSFVERPLGLNMLEYDTSRPEEKTFIVNEIQGIFNKLFSQETMGPMFEQYMRNALLLLMEDADHEPATLIDVSRIFTDDDYRKAKLERIANPVVVDFWTKEAIKAGGEASLANMTPYITSKFNNFVANDYLRPIIGQTTSSFKMRDVMDQQKILLVNLSKGKIGDINAGLLGMVMTGKILMAALSRGDISEKERRDFNVYIDEFQNFTTDSIAIILSEARKYRLNLTIAHQFIAQLEEKVRDAVFGNVGSMAAFRVGAQDAEFLEKQFAPVFSQRDLINIDNFNAHLKLLIKGATSDPFNIQTLPHPDPDPNVLKKIEEQSRKEYGRDRRTVEQEILERMRN
jgi:hypothetical protein